MSQMRAALVTAHGGPEHMQVGSAPIPFPPAGWVRVKVLACALNMLDVFVRRGMPGVHIDLPHIPGGDVVGTVDALGAGSQGPPLGTLVLLDPAIDGHTLGETMAGGLADYVIAPAANVIALPTAPEEAPRYAALPIAYGTARRMLFTRAKLTEGETVAVLGATGGVGVACVQLAAMAGARVIAASSSVAKLRQLEALGATDLIDTSTDDFSAEIWRLTGRRGADVVVDYLGSSTWAGSIRATKRGGRIVTCGASTGFVAETDLRYVWTRELNILGSDGWTRQDLSVLVDQVAGGKLDPVIHAVYPLSRIREAVADLEERRAVGKVIVVPHDV